MNAPDEPQPRPDDADSNDSGSSSNESDEGVESSSAESQAGDVSESGAEQARKEDPSPSSAGKTEPSKTPSRSTPSATRTSNDPGHEEITPEYVEEETIRNDFVLRWAVVLLAFLVACTPIHSTRTLVHVRTGEYLAANGLLPPRVDPFSIGAGERTWANTEWLFDLLVAGVYAAAGPIGLTLLKAALAALTFYFVAHTSRSGTSSWWGSVCAAVAVMVCALRFTALPEIVTLLGLALTLWLLVRWKQSDSTSLPWALIPVFLVWANSDARVSFGLVLLLLYGLGEFVSELLDSSAAFAPGKRSRFWMVFGGCVVATVCNPFGWETLLAPVKFYASYYPALRDHAFAGLAEGQPPAFEALQYLSMTSSTYWQQADIAGVCGVFLLIVGLGSAALNHRRLDVGAVFVLAGFAAFAVATAHELAAAALVASVLGTLAAQEWYADVSGPTSTSRGALAFSRGGRACTVFGLIAIAFLAMNGRLFGPASTAEPTRARGLGFGLDPSLATRIAGLETALAEVPTEFRAFHTTREEGDRLVWLGRNSYIDGRVALFAERNGVSVYDEFDDLVDSLRDDAWLSNQPPPSESALDPDRIDYVVHALAGDVPPSTYLVLVRSPLWQLYEVAGSDAVLVRTSNAIPSDASDEDRSRIEERIAFVGANGFDPVAEVFGGEREPLGVRSDLGRSTITYPTWFVPRSLETTPELERARQLRRHLQWVHQGGFGRLPLFRALGFAYLTLDESNEALVDDSQQADAYTVLGQIRWHLANDLEPPLVSGRPGGPLPRTYQSVYEFRRLEALNEVSQAVRIDPDDLESRAFLFLTAANSGQLDLAIRHRDEVVRILESRTTELSNPQLERMLDEEQRSLRLERIDKVRAEADKQIEAKAPKLFISQQVRRFGCLDMAVELMEQGLLEQPEQMGNPRVLEYAARVYLETGRLEDALEKLAQLEQLGAEVSADGHRVMAIAAASAGRHEQAIESLAAEREIHRRLRDLSMFENALPFVAAPPQMSMAESDGWLKGLPVRAGMSALGAIQSKQQMGEVSTLMMLLQLESGRLDDARETAVRLMENHVDSPLLPLVVEYSKLIGARPENVFRDDLPPAPPAVDE